jgi:type II secretory pathway pseudopilin PulG
MPSGKRQRGIALLGVLVLLMLLPLLLLNSVELWSTRIQRQHEAELLAHGQEIAQALASYRDADVSGAYPRSLDELLRDRRSLVERHHLRRRYLDPMTQSATWGLIYDQDQRIAGVYSLGKGMPLKRAGFPKSYEAFAKARSYADWRFDAPAPGQ